MRSITLKFILAFVAVSLVSTLLVVVFTRWRSREEFRSFLIDQNRPGIVMAFSEYYDTYHSWAGINPSDIPSRPVPVPMPGPGPLTDPGPFTLVDPSTGRVVLAGEGYHLGALVPPPSIQGGIPIQFGNKTVGVLLTNRPGYQINATGSAFLDRINLQIFWSGLTALGLALLLAVVLSRTLTRPIRELTAATQVVAEGTLGHEVPVRSRDELGQLASSFNRMSADLVRSLNARRQMTADIAHELRTPISIILGHAEAVHDGVLPASPETVEIIREEAGRLERLVDELHTLSMADAGELELNLGPCAPRQLLLDTERVYAHLAAQGQVELEVEASPDLPEIRVDAERIRGIFANALDNALRYTPPNGRIILSAKLIGDTVEFGVQDSGSGIAPAELDRIFERFHRVEQSRTRGGGGSGLGLAIAKSIVEKHGGTIWAESSVGAGLTIAFRLPVNPPPPSENR